MKVDTNNINKVVALVLGVLFLFTLLVVYGYAEKRHHGQASLNQGVPVRIVRIARILLPRRQEQIRTDITVNPGFGLHEAGISPHSTAEIRFQMPTIVTPNGDLVVNPQPSEQGYSVTIGCQVALIQFFSQNFIGVITPELPDGMHSVVVTTPVSMLTTTVVINRTIPVFNIHPTKPGNFPGTGIAFAEVGGIATRFLGVVGDEDLVVLPGETLHLQIGLSGVHNPADEMEGSYEGVAEITTPGGKVFTTTARSHNRFVLRGSQTVVIKIPPTFPFNSVTSKLKITVTINGAKSRNFIIIRAVQAQATDT